MNFNLIFNEHENKINNRILIFENGKVFKGKGFGAVCATPESSIFEIVFNTSVSGYQEILSDPSYFSQIVCMTYPIIGNYGIKEKDYESYKMHAGALIVSEYYNCDYINRKNLNDELIKYNIPAICGVDTREITRIIRDEGSMRVMIADSNIDINEALKKIKNSFCENNCVSKVSCKKIQEIDDIFLFKYKMDFEYKFNIVVVDCGVKYGILRELVIRKCKVSLVPYNATVGEILDLNPDGILFSNGPGDPQDNYEVIETIKKLKGKLPIFGVCLGHQMIAIAAGAKTFKMKFGHRGGNHPVKEIKIGKVFITSQNHSYSIDKDTLKNTNFKVTHINLLDGSAEGIEDEDDFIFSVQYHPEGSPGPKDNSYLFDKFLFNIDKFKSVRK